MVNTKHYVAEVHNWVIPCQITQKKQFTSKPYPFRI